MEISRRQLRTIMYYEFRNKLSVTECHQNMCERLASILLLMIQSEFGFRKFKAENFNIEDEPRSGRPIEVDCEQLKQIIHQNRNASTRTIALELGICHKTIVNALKSINITLKFNRWVTHELTPEDKRTRKASYLALLRDCVL
ncbi:Histone-lysine N-methyltransferase SETMAR [Araneus ventricosus]|uniref:Histone-lysine N-methyltransferase SETMAR n=1 Tax=Araneus ventricosus TaxID=182803 RepID=A0A4Y2KK19_ARAVE|nr:Histone-lysine N-methyltransferase SETMAR [Araneus ventricosus]